MPSATTALEVTTLPFSAPQSGILEAFDRDGLVVLSGAVGATSISNILKELKLDPEKASGKPVTALAAKSPTLVRELMLSSKLQDLLNARLSKTTKIWHGEERLINTSRPQLSATVVFDSPPGTEAEPFHRHDDIYLAQHPLEIPVEVWALLAVNEVGKEDGAVDAILGSQNWNDEWDYAGHPLSSAEMAPGSLMLLHGSTVHRGGSNFSSGLRRYIGISWTQGHLRQEENQYLNISKETAMALDEDTQRLIGYRINAPMG